MQWGDVVEFAEAERDIDGGFSVEELDFLRSHLERKVAVRWINEAGEETVKGEIQFGLDGRSGIANSDLVRPSYHPGKFYHVFPRNRQAHYLVPLLELGGNDALRGQPLKSVEGNLTKIIERARAIGCRVLLLGMRIPPSYGAEYSEGFAAIYDRLHCRIAMLKGKRHL